MNEWADEENSLDDREEPPSELEVALRRRFMRRYGRERTANDIAYSIIRNVEELPPALRRDDVVEAFVWFFRCVYGRMEPFCPSYHTEDTHGLHAALQRLPRRERRAVIACLGDLCWNKIKHLATRKRVKPMDEVAFSRTRRQCDRFLRRLTRTGPTG